MVILVYIKSVACSIEPTENHYQLGYNSKPLSTPYFHLSSPWFQQQLLAVFSEKAQRNPLYATCSAPNSTDAARDQQQLRLFWGQWRRRTGLKESEHWTYTS